MHSLARHKMHNKLQLHCS